MLLFLYSGLLIALYWTAYETVFSVWCIRSKKRKQLSQWFNMKLIVIANALKQKYSYFILVLNST